MDTSAPPTRAPREGRRTPVACPCAAIAGLALALSALSACRRDSGPQPSAPESARPNPSAEAPETEQPTVAVHLGQPAVVPGAGFTLRVELRVPPGWHTYWENPGETGLAPALAWRLPEGVRFERLLFPVPRRFVDEGIVSLGYEGVVCLLAEFQADAALPAGSVDLGVDIDWMVCKEMCLPVRSSSMVQANVDPGAHGLPEDPATATWRARLPHGTDGWTISARRVDGQVALAVQPGGDGPFPGADAWAGLRLFPVRSSGLDLSGPLAWTLEGGRWSTTVVQGLAPYAAGDRLEAVLASGKADDWVGWRISARVTD